MDSEVLGAISGSSEIFAFRARLGSLSCVRAVFETAPMRLAGYRAQSDARIVAREFLEEHGIEPRPPRREGAPDIIIGSKIFAEQYTLAEMFAPVIESTTSLTVEPKTGLGGTKICFEALRTGEIDLCPEYTGTGLLAILEVPAQTRDGPRERGQGL